MGYIGPICRTVDDTAMMLNLLSRPDPRDWSALPPSGADFELPRRSLAGLKVAFSPTLGYARVMPEITKIVELAVRKLEDMGARSADRGVGNELVSTCRYRWSPYNT